MIPIADAEARRVALDEDAADAGRPRGAAHAAVHEIEAGGAGAGDPALLAVERVALWRLVGAGHHVGGRRSRLRLGDRDGRLVPVEHPREVPPLLGFGAVGGEGPDHAEAALHHDARGDPAHPRDLLDHEQDVQD